MSHWLINPRSKDYLKSLRWFKRLGDFSVSSVTWLHICLLARTLLHSEAMCASEGGLQSASAQSMHVSRVVKAACGSSLPSTRLAKEVCALPSFLVASPACIPSPGRELSVSCFDRVLGCTGKDGLLGFWGLGGIASPEKILEEVSLGNAIVLPEPVSD